MADVFAQWLPLRSLSVGDLPKHGEIPAVYALRDSATGEILKYGKSYWLRRRVFGEYLGGIGGETTQRIHNELFRNNMVGRVEVAWIETKDDAEACLKEKAFRAAYKQANGRRPKWDLIG
jgi:hypothetical protein